MHRKRGRKRKKESSNSLWFKREVAGTEVRKQSSSEVGVQRRTTTRLGEGEEQQ